MVCCFQAEPKKYHERIADVEAAIAIALCGPAKEGRRCSLSNDSLVLGIRLRTVSHASCLSMLRGITFVFAAVPPVCKILRVCGVAMLLIFRRHYTVPTCGRSSHVRDSSGMFRCFIL